MDVGEDVVREMDGTLDQGIAEAIEEAEGAGRPEQSEEGNRQATSGAKAVVEPGATRAGGSRTTPISRQRHCRSDVVAR